MKIEFSIIIPTYNRANLILETLDSILAQTYKNWECIVIDDGSSDNTISLLNEYSKKDTRFRIYQRPKKRAKGASSCRNYGFELSKGQYINWFDDDDLMMDNYLMTVDNNLLKCNYDLVIVNFFVSKNNKTFKSHFESENLIKDFYTHKIPAYLHRTFFKKSFINNIKLNEDLIIYEDWEYLIRVLLFNPRIVKVNEPLYLYRVHENSITQTFEKGKIYFSKSFIKMVDEIAGLMIKGKCFDNECEIYLIKSTNNFLKLSLQNREFILSIKIILIVLKRVNINSLLVNNKIILNFLKALFSFLVFNKGYKFLKYNNILINKI